MEVEAKEEGRDSEYSGYILSMCNYVIYNLGLIPPFYIHMSHFSPSSPLSHDVVLGCGGVPHSHYVRQLLSSVKSVWEMKLPPEFVSLSLCLHVCMYLSVTVSLL